MAKNKLLNLVLFLCNFFLVSVVLSFIVLTLGMVYWHINPGFFADNPIPDFGKNALFKYTAVNSSSVVGTPLIISSATINNISFASMYLLYSQCAAILILIFMAVREFTNIIRSIRKIQTFVIDNAWSFKKIGKYMFLVFVLSGLQYSVYNESTLFGIYIHLPVLVIALIASTLSEIFKEGNALLEDNRGTI
jgi:hypothetical protein